MEHSRTYSIGRDRAADIPVADDSVSRLHAQVTLSAAGGLFLVDCGSTNGTFLIRANGDEESISQAHVGMGEAVKFGSVIVAARDLLEALRNFGRPPAPAPPLPEPAARGLASPMPHSDRLVRCGCGAVRSAKQTCVLCGEKR